MNSKLIRSLLLLTGLLIGAVMAHAQPLSITYQSLELRVAQAEAVYRGTVSNRTAVFVEAPDSLFGGYREDGTKRPDGYMRHTITVTVDEVIKGKPLKTLSLVQDISFDDKRIAQWAESHTAFLWFNGGSAWSNLGAFSPLTNAPHWITIRLDKPVPAEAGWSTDSPIYSMDFTHLTDSKEMLARVRTLAKSQKSVAQTHKFQFFPESRSVEAFASLEVPVDASLEKQARRMIASPNSFLRAKPEPTAADWMRCNIRCSGVDALRHFKSARNIKLLKSLLNDRDYSLSASDQPALNGTLVRHYVVRTRAWEILKSWGFDVPKPVSEALVK